MTVSIRYTPPGASEADSIHLEFQALPGARVEVRLDEPDALRPAAGDPVRDDWKDAAQKIVAGSEGDVWLSTSAVRQRLLADGIEIGRSALSMKLGEMADRGEIARRGTGPHTVYGAARPQNGHGG
ncbi:hypothetical protein VR45_34905 [Streptomyces sp. NRRL S-495]|nr:hypothetical protein VR45_34905 [Streptomyces sp. NRRL S-495]